MRARLLLAVLSVSGAASAGWYRVPLQGADVTALAVARSERGVVYCGTSEGNVYVSRDAGETWSPVRPVNQFPGYVVSALVPDTAAPGKLWAALAGGDRGALVAVSEDRGAHWTVEARWTRSVDARALAQDPRHPDVLYCGGDDGVFVTRDGGRTWTASGSGVPGLALVQVLACDPERPDTVYAGTYRQAFRSADAGRTWERIAQGMVLDATVYSFSFDPSRSRRIWVSTCGWVYRSEDGGDSWKRFTEGFANRRAPALEIDPLDPRRLYAGTVGGLHRSTDGGRTWELLSRDTLDVSALAVDPCSGRLYLGTLGEGMFYSDDHGATLVPASGGLEEARVSALARDPARPDRVLLLRAYGGARSGVWECEEGKARLLSSDVPASVSMLAAASSPSGTVWVAGSASELFFSRDDGARFAPVASPPPGRIVAIFGDPLPGISVVTDAGLFGSADGAAFRRVGAVRGSPQGARLVLGPGGQVELSVRTGEGAYVGRGGAFVFRRTPLLSGGFFRESESAREEPFLSYAVRDNRLELRLGGEQGSLVLPRSDLSVSSVALSGDGSLYVATMGDGLFFYRPGGEGAAASASGSR